MKLLHSLKIINKHFVKKSFIQRYAFCNICAHSTASIKTQSSSISKVAQHAMDLESKYGAHNYHPIPVVIARGEGIHVWDVDGRKYMDFLSSYSAVNQGHCHPKIIDTLKQQSEILTLTSRAFHNDSLGKYCEFVTKYFNYDRVLPMNTGVEACESAVKLARRWGYEIKNIPPNEAIMVFVNNNFWGRSIAAVSASTDPESYTNYGPYVPNFEKIPYNDIEALEKIFKEKGDKIAGFMCEPIQGEAGVVIPDDGYLKSVRKLCTDYKILFIADEVQTGLGRCGKKLCVDYEKVKPDIITLGKALSGGTYPISAVLSNHEVMNVLTPGTHGSTYGGNPLACNIAITSLKVLEEEDMINNSYKMGKYLLDNLINIKNNINDKNNIIQDIRGKGLFCAIEINTDKNKNINAWELCLLFKKYGLLAKPTHDTIIRLAPPLVINQNQIDLSLEIIEKSLKELLQRS